MGIDWNGPIPYDSDDDTVIVDPPPQIITDRDFQELSETINPLDPTSQYGIELYIQSVEFVLNKIRE